MHHLASGMNAGISSPCSKRLDGPLWVKIGNRLFQNSLDTARIALSLPARKIRTLILQAESNPTKDW